MKDEVRKEDASVRIVGREFIIVIVVVFSSLSFTLGFFVGKNSGKRPGTAVASPPEPVAVESPRGATASQPETSVSYEPFKEVNGPADEGKPINGLSPSVHPERVHVEGDKNAAVKGSAKDTPEDAVKKAVKDTGGTTSASSAKMESAAVLYTVQLGALKNAAEARNLKAVFAKKGYQTYITVVRAGSNEQIYKVRAGEFKEKKEAEILARRLKQNDGLASFVTTKND